MTGHRPVTKVLFVMGHGASGSTILGNSLGQVEGFFHPGELRTLWDEGLKGTQTCGCGLQVDRCEVWTQVVKTGFGDGVDVERFGAWHREAVRVRYTSRLLRMRPGRPTGWPALDAYVEVASRLYHAIADVTGARVIVDTSKRAGDAALLRLLPGIDPYFVHLVRDPRATVHSWTRRGGGAPFLPTVLNWIAYAGLDEAIRWRVGRDRSTRLRHEDFVAQPRRTLDELTRLVGERPRSLPLLDERTVDMQPIHTMSGHWSRHATGPIDLRADTSWRKEMPTGRRIAVSALTLPLLVRYGYPLRTGPR